MTNCDKKYMFYSSVSQQLGHDPLLGRQNLCFSTIIVIYGSPNCVIFCFVGRQLPNVENHCSIGLDNLDSIEVVQ